jgi:hypothetical protein
MMFYRLIQGSPPMAAFRVQNKVVVSWPAYGTIVPTLKSTPNLSDPITWTDVGIAPTLINGNYFVTNSIAGSAFYRLFY